MNIDIGHKCPFDDKNYEDHYVEDHDDEYDVVVLDDDDDDVVDNYNYDSYIYDY